MLPLCCGSGQKGEDVRALGLALRKMAKGLRKRRPRAKSLEGFRVILSQAPIGTPRRKGAVFSDYIGPIFEQFAVLKAHVRDGGGKTGGFDGIIPGGETQGNLMLRDSSEGEEFRSRRRTTKTSGDGGDGIEDVLPVYHGLGSFGSVY